MNRPEWHQQTVVKKLSRQVSSAINPRRHRHRRLIKKIWKYVFLLYTTIFVGVGGFYLFLHILRPTHPLKKTYHDGVWYERIIIEDPVLAVIHVVHIDLTKGGIQPLVTPPRFTPAKSETITLPARTTTDFLNEFKVQVAINGSYFYPEFDYSPWHFYPKKEDPVTPVGTYIAEGVEYSPARNGFASFCISTSGSISLHSSGCPSGTAAGISGGRLLIRNGVSPFGEKNFYYVPRAVIAINNTEKWIELIAVDGRQSMYSQGLATHQLVEFLLKRNVTSALELDSGGSTTLVIQEPWGPRLLNVPINGAIPFKQRFVATHIGFRIDKFGLKD